MAGHFLWEEMDMSRRKVLAALMFVVGILFFVIPIVYRYTGQTETDRLTQEFEQILEGKQKDETKVEEAEEKESEAAGSSAYAAVFAEGDVIAILEIESLDICYPVVEGCSSSDLNRAIGHMSETAMIGENGNCVLCGHNGSRYGEFFTKLNQIEAGDEVTLLDRNGELHSYKAAECYVVGSYDNSIKTQSGKEELTLFTCAERGTKRFVVKCIPVGEDGVYGE